MMNLLFLFLHGVVHSNPIPSYNIGENRVKIDKYHNKKGNSAIHSETPVLLLGIRP